MIFPSILRRTLKFFADDTSLFSLVLDQVQSSNKLNSDLQKICDWAYQWKMSFNPDPSKQAVEIYFSRKLKSIHPPALTFNNNNVKVCDFHKHLGLILDSKLVFDHHLHEKINKANKGIGLINRLRKFLSTECLLTIYKTFVRPHLDYGDVIYDCPGNSTFVQKLESIQYNACLAISGCFRGTSREKLYSELGLESLSDRRLSRRLTLFYKIVNGLAPRYLSNYLPPMRVALPCLRRRPQIYQINVRTERFRNSFFPFCMSEWNNLDSRIKNLQSISKFKSAILDFLRPKPTLNYRLGNISGFPLLARLRVGFSHLREHKFRHGFLDTIDPFCNCRGNFIETTEHFLLHCSNYSNGRTVLFGRLQNLDVHYIPLNPAFLSRLLLYGDPNRPEDVNRKILIAVINFLCDSNRFSGPLF